MHGTILPGQFARRAEFYYQLAQYLNAGVPFISALRQLERTPPARSYREPIQQFLTHLTAGRTIHESIAGIPGWMPEFDLALLKAGEESGRLDGSLRLLAKYYEERAAMIRQMLGDLAYPVVLLHFAVFLLPFASFFISGDWVSYLRQTLGVLLPIYVVAALFIFAGQGNRGEAWRSIWEKVLSAVPLLGRGRRSLALARASAALEALLAAGVTIVEAWRLSAAASGSPTLKRVVARWEPALESGQTPAELVNESSFFPDVFKSQYSSGEISGRLEENLGRLHEYFQEEGTRKLRHLAAWMPRLFYFGIVFVIGWKIISFWQGYFEQIGQAAGW